MVNVFTFWTVPTGFLWERCQFSPVFSFSAFWLMILCDKVLAVKSVMTLAWQGCQTAQRSILALALTSNNIQVSNRPLWVDVCWCGCVGTINFASCQVINSNCTITKHSERQQLKAKQPVRDHTESQAGSGITSYKERRRAEERKRGQVWGFKILLLTHSRIWYTTKTIAIKSEEKTTFL